MSGQLKIRCNNFAVNIITFRLHLAESGSTWPRVNCPNSGRSAHNLLHLSPFCPQSPARSRNDWHAVRIVSREDRKLVAFSHMKIPWPFWTLGTRWTSDVASTQPVEPLIFSHVLLRSRSCLSLQRAYRHSGKINLDDGQKGWIGMYVLYRYPNCTLVVYLDRQILRYIHVIHTWIYTTCIDY